MAIVPTYERQTKSGRGKNIIGVDLPLYQYTLEKKEWLINSKNLTMIPI